MRAESTENKEDVSRVGDGIVGFHRKGQRNHCFI